MLPEYTDEEIERNLDILVATGELKRVEIDGEIKYVDPKWLPPLSLSDTWLPVGWEDKF